MIAPKTAPIENAFPDDVDELIERVLLRYRPILSHVVMGSFRSHLQRAIKDNYDLTPWLPVGPCRPIHGTGALTAGQVALLGGTRPTRILHSVAYDLALRLDGGDKKSLDAAELVLIPASRALESFVDHHVVVPVKGLGARLRRLRDVVRLGVAAQIAALMGALYEHHLWAGRRELEEEPEFIRRYFLGALQVFGRLKLSPRDQGVFRDYYIEACDIEELADERGLGLDAEVARRHGFLKRLATALEAEVDALAGKGGRHTVDARDPDALTGVDRDGRTGAADRLGSAEAGAAGSRALIQAAARAVQPRKP